MSPTPSESDGGIATKKSPFSTSETVERFRELLGQKNVKVFAVIDQAVEARRVGLELRDTTLILFGDPTAGTPVMDAAPLAALDLPLKVLVWDDAGQTKVSYHSPASIGERHHLPAALAAKLQVIDGLTDALISG